MSKNYGEVPQSAIDLYKQLIDSHPEIDVKGGKKLPNTSVNGHMFSFTCPGQDPRISVLCCVPTSS